MNINLKQFTTILLFTVIIAAIVLRLFALFLSDNFDGIAADKIVHANRIVAEPSNIGHWVDPAHGPIHLYLIAAVLKFFNNSFFAPRLVSFFMGIAIFLPYYFFVKSIFNKNTAIISLFILSFFPLHIIYSTLSTAEATFLFFLFSGLCFFIRYDIEKKPLDLVLSGLLIGLSSMCRFEGGVFIIILSFFLFRRWKSFLVFICFGSILPIIWLIMNYITQGSFFHFLRISDSITFKEYNILHLFGKEATFFKKIIFWPKTICKFFGDIIFIFGIVGIFIYGLRKKIRFVFLLFISILSVFVFKTVKEELGMQERYGMSLGVLFIPFFGFFFENLLRKIRIKHAQVLIVLFFLFVVVRNSYIGVINFRYFPGSFKKMVEYIQNDINIKQDGLIFIETEDPFYIKPVIAYSGLSEKSFRFSRWKINRYIDSRGYLEMVKRKNKKEQLKYVILVSREKSLPEFNLVFESGLFKIYEI